MRVRRLDMDPKQPVTHGEFEQFEVGMEKACAAKHDGLGHEIRTMREAMTTGISGLTADVKELARCVNENRGASQAAAQTGDRNWGRTFSVIALIISLVSSGTALAVALSR